VSRSRVPDELELVLLLAGGAERRSSLRARTRALLARADFDRLQQDLADRRLLALIGSRAIAAGGDAVPDSFRAAVEHSLTATRAQNLRVEWATGRIAGWLAAAGIRALPLKGPLLAWEAHGDSGVRATADADLLVAPADLDAAAAVLLEHGFSAPTDARRADGLPDLHLVMEHPELPQVELHWRVHWYERAFSADMLARAVAGPDGLLRPQPDDLAASILLFYARDGFHGLRLAADLAAWWDRHRDELPPAFLEGHARRYPELAPVLTAAARVVERFTGAPATAWLGSETVSGRRVDLAVRLADWAQHGDVDQLWANISLVSGLLGSRRSAREFARRELLSYGERPAARAAHLAKLSARYVFALWSVRGNRTWTPELP
jgi:putative nucleotidyltransferase-like protein